MNQTKRKISRTLQIITGLLLTLTLSGCFEVNGNFKEIRNSILNNFENSYSKNIEYSFGNITLSLADIFVTFSDDEGAEFASDILDDISNVQIGIYKIKIQNIKNLNNQNWFLRKTVHTLTEQGWNILALIVKHNNMTAVLSKENGENIPAEMLVVNMNENKLLLAELSGNLNKIIDLALKEKGQNLNIAGDF